MSGGTVDCWGDNTYGQLGNGTTDASSIPSAVPGLSGVTQLSGGGDDHFCAVLSDRTVDCWGFNLYGGLGNGTTADSPVPTPVTGLGNVTQVSAGEYHSCAVVDSVPGAASMTQVECWGRDIFGELGDNRSSGGIGTLVSTTPVGVVGLTGVTEVSAGSNDTCALMVGGTVECWGFATDGQLGDGRVIDGYTEYSAVPVLVVNLAGVTQISSRFDGTCALLTGGSVECWGSNSVGELGDGTPGGGSDFTDSSSVPVAVVGLAGVTEVDTGGLNGCAVVAGASISCWGDNGEFQLSNDHVNYPSPIPIVGIP